MRRLPMAAQHGATLVEILLAIALSGIMLPALAAALVTAHASRPSTQQQLEANDLLREAQEAVRSAREASWDNVSSDGTFHPAVAGSSWTLVSGSETIDGFTRQIVIGPTERDSGGAIVASGGTTDPSTREIVITVSWNTPSPANISSDTYLTRWQQDSVWQQTTAADFGSGNLSDTVITNTAGGEVQLDSNGSGGFQPTGTFESQTFDAGSSVSWQAIDFTLTIPGDSSVRFQLATNTDNSTWNYTGPDGTSGSYFTSQASVPLAISSGRYIRYKAFFSATSDTLQTPVLEDITLNYAH